MEATLLGLVRRVLVEDAAAALLPLDCKLESSMPAAATQDGIPIMPLGVKN
jgi:phosphoethanolamine/phosphocholine phosphatase